MRSAAVLFAVLLIASVVRAPAAAGAQFYYINPSEIDLTVLLPPPPDVASADERSDEVQVASAVAGRSPTQFLHAEEDSVRTVFFYERSVGPRFTRERLPVTAAFF